MFMSYYKNRGRRKHYVCVSNKGYREYLLKKGWHLKGGCAEKGTKYGTIIQRLVEKYDCFTVCSFQFKNYFWEDIEDEHLIEKQRVNEGERMSVQKNKIKKGLSKSLFIKGLQCQKCLYLNKYHPELKDELTTVQKAIFASGTDVGCFAQKLFPSGIEVPYKGMSYSDQLSMTAKEIEKGTKDIYEATFSYNNVFV